MFLHYHHHSLHSRNLGEVYPVDKLKQEHIKKDDNEFAGFPMKQPKDNLITVSIITMIKIGTIYQVLYVGKLDISISSTSEDRNLAREVSVRSKLRRKPTVLPLSSLI